MSGSNANGASNYGGGGNGGRGIIRNNYDHNSYYNSNYNHYYSNSNNNYWNNNFSSNMYSNNNMNIGNYRSSGDRNINTNSSSNSSSNSKSARAVDKDEDEEISYSYFSNADEILKIEKEKSLLEKKIQDKIKSANSKPTTSSATNTTTSTTDSGNISSSSGTDNTTHTDSNSMMLSNGNSNSKATSSDDSVVHNARTLLLKYSSSNTLPKNKRGQFNSEFMHAAAEGSTASLVSLVSIPGPILNSIPCPDLSPKFNPLLVLTADRQTISQVDKEPLSTTSAASNQIRSHHIRSTDPDLTWLNNDIDNFVQDMEKKMDIHKRVQAVIIGKIEQVISSALRNRSMRKGNSNNNGIGTGAASYGDGAGNGNMKRPISQTDDLVPDSMSTCGSIKAVLFGSCKTKLALPCSDIDIVLIPINKKKSNNSSIASSSSVINTTTNNTTTADNGDSKRPRVEINSSTYEFDITKIKSRLQICRDINKTSAPTIVATSDIDEKKMPVIETASEVNKKSVPTIVATGEVSKKSVPTIVATSEVNKKSVPIIGATSEVNKKNAPTIETACEIDAETGLDYLTFVCSLLSSQKFLTGVQLISSSIPVIKAFIKSAEILSDETEGLGLGSDSPELDNYNIPLDISIASLDHKGLQSTNFVLSMLGGDVDDFSRELLWSSSSSNNNSSNNNSSSSNSNNNNNNISSSSSSSSSISSNSRGRIKETGDANASSFILGPSAQSCPRPPEKCLSNVVKMLRALLLTSFDVGAYSDEYFSPQKVPAAAAVVMPPSNSLISRYTRNSAATIGSTSYDVTSGNTSQSDSNNNNNNNNNSISSIRSNGSSSSRRSLFHGLSTAISSLCSNNSGNLQFIPYGVGSNDDKEGKHHYYNNKKKESLGKPYSGGISTFSTIALVLAAYQSYLQKSSFASAANTNHNSMFTMEGSASLSSFPSFNELHSVESNNNKNYCNNYYGGSDDGYTSQTSLIDADTNRNASSATSAGDGGGSGGGGYELCAATLLIETLNLIGSRFQYTCQGIDILQYGTTNNNNSSSSNNNNSNTASSDYNGTFFPLSSSQIQSLRSVCCWVSDPVSPNFNLTRSAFLFHQVRFYSKAICSTIVERVKLLSDERKLKNKLKKNRTKPNINLASEVGGGAPPQ